LASVVTYFVFRTGLGAVCLLAGLEKARAPRDFFEGVRQYRLVPARLTPLVGGALIAVELAIGILLVSGLVPVIAGAAAIALFTVFAAALAISLARSNRAPCHCFGASDVETISPLALLRALALAGLAVAVLVLALDGTPWPAGDDVAPGLLLAAGLVAATRLSGLMPLAWSFLRAEATFYPTPTRRISFRHQPLSVPLHPRETQ
jgi:membrane-associated protease RseP (regulator of RpoE activity)